VECERREADRLSALNGGANQPLILAGVSNRVLRVAMPPPHDQSKWFAEEVLPHEPALRGYLRNRFPALDADDVVQDAYFKLFRSGARGRLASTKAYLFSIARNTALTLFQRRRIFSDIPVSDLPPSLVMDEGSSADEAARARERFELMIAALSSLPPRCRDVMRLAVLHGLANAEIAARLGLAENTVRVHLARGIKKSADFLRERGECP
jgi:RNA polymerase sigma factor (sigma-70 family)